MLKDFLQGVSLQDESISVKTLAQATVVLGKKNSHFFEPRSCSSQTDLPVPMLSKAKVPGPLTPQNKKRGSFGHRAEYSPFPIWEGGGGGAFEGY